jgi:hypothetical protein
MKHPVLILGASAAMGRALAEAFAAEGKPLWLAGRRLPELEKDCENLRLRYGVPCKAIFFDAEATDTHTDWVNALETPPQTVVCAFGYLSKDPALPASQPELIRTAAVNYTGAISVLNALSTRLQPGSVVVGISSIAGDRGRASNGIYSSAKAGFSAYLSALRQQLNKQGVQVLTVKPGYVYSAMTAHLDLPARLTATPAQVARDIQRAIRRGVHTCYTPGFWRWIMWVIRLIPERVFMKLRF